MKVQELMTRDVQTCGPDDSLERAAQLMWDYDCGCTPVIDANSQLAGMLTDRDICMAAYTRGAPLSALRVGGAMSTRLSTCSPNDDVKVAQSRMGEAQVRRLPVVNGRVLVGIISLNDIAVSAGHGAKGAELQDSARTLAAICEHREASSTLPVRAA